MNMLPFVEKLERLGLGEQGVTIFINAFPAKVETGILLRERLIGAAINHDLPGYIKFMMQVIVRAPTYDGAQTAAILAVKGLTQIGGDLGDYKVNYIRPHHVPVGYPISAGEQVEFNTDMDCCVVDPAWE